MSTPLLTQDVVWFAIQQPIATAGDGIVAKQEGGGTYAANLGLISFNVANLLMEKMNQRLDLPSIQTACTTSQGAPNKKAEEEAVNGFALMKKYGFHQMRHCFGFLKELVSFSIEKLERHIELCPATGPEQAPDYLMEPYDPEGVDTIKRNGSNANYMRDDHTPPHTGKSFLF